MIVHLRLHRQRCGHVLILGNPLFDDRGDHDRIHEKLAHSTRQSLLRGEAAEYSTTATSVFALATDRGIADLWRLRLYAI